MQGKRLWITAPYEVSAEPFELADQPSAGNILLRAERTLISAGTELAIVMGTHISFTTGGAWPRFPMALGYTFCGRVVAVGAGVTEVSLGDLVLSGAPHASLAEVPAGKTLKVPVGCSAEDALLAHLSSIPQVGLHLAAPRYGEGIVVFGQGLIGSLAARFALIAGLRPVIAVDPIVERREFAAAAGLVPVDPNESDPSDVYKSLTGGRLPEIVIEATGAPSVINEALRVAGDMARVVLMGSPRGRVEIDPYNDVHRKGVSVIGAHANWAAPIPTAWNPFTNDRQRHYAMALIVDGSLSTKGLISHHIAPARARETYRALADRAPGYMGVVIDWSE